MLVRTLLFAPALSPPVPMVANPIQQSTFKTDVATCFFGFKPLVFQDFLPLGKEFLIQAGTSDELFAVLAVFGHVKPRNQRYWI